MKKPLPLRLDGKVIGHGHPVFIIAEAGVNHNGSLRLAKKLVDAAKNAGADAVKFQTFRTEELVTRNAPKARYQVQTVPKGSQFEMLKRLEFSESQFKELYAYCHKRGILFLSTPFDFPSVAFLKKLNVIAFKISSGDLTNLPLIRAAADCGKPLILSTGMATLREVHEAVRAVQGCPGLALLHCTSNYPTSPKDVNLRAMGTLARAFHVPVGYSDHTLGLDVPIAAAALGARIIEKHFTLDKNFPGPDHRASLSPQELCLMVRSIRDIEQALGDGVKKPQSSELEVKAVGRKSVVTATDIPKKTQITREMLTLKRPGTGIKPKFLGSLIGRRLKRDVPQDHVLRWEEVAR